MAEIDQESKWMLAVKVHHDKAAFQALYNRYKSPVLSFLHCRIRDLAKAEDLLQEVFIKLFRFRESYEEGKKFSAWFWTIVKNTLYDFLRKTQRELKIVEKSAEQDEVSAKILEEGQDWNTPELETLKKLDLQHLDQLLRKLNERDREFFLLRIFSELKFEEIAQNYQVAPSTVRVSYHRSKKFLLSHINLSRKENLS